MMLPWTKSGTPAQNESAAIPAFSQKQETEVVVVIFRVIVLALVILVPGVAGSGRHPLQQVSLAALAALYCVMSLMSCAWPDRYNLRRWLIVAMDMMLITLWIHLSGRWDLFAFYYLVIVVAAMWFRVIGGALAAIFANFFFLLMWLRMVIASPSLRPPTFTNAMALNLLLLVMVGCLVGYIAEVQERERLHRLESQELIDNYQREIELAAQLKPLLDSGVSLEDASLDIGSAAATARPFGGGDYLDCITLPDNRLGLIIGDVSGKSVRAQARLPLFKYAFRAMAPLHQTAADLFTNINKTLAAELSEELYITAFYVIIDSRNQSIDWCNAGHVPPLLLQDSRITELAASGPALGMFAQSTYKQQQTPWTPQTWLLLYTDGLTDALDRPSSDSEKIDQLLTELSRDSSLTSQQMAEVLLGEAKKARDDQPSIATHLLHLGQPHKSTFDETAVHRDDITLAVIRNIVAARGETID